MISASQDESATLICFLLAHETAAWLYPVVYPVVYLVVPGEDLPGGGVPSRPVGIAHAGQLKFARTIAEAGLLVMV
eukprot:3451939-Prymnesium_polylepis.1